MPLRPDAPDPEPEPTPAAGDHGQSDEGGEPSGTPASATPAAEETFIDNLTAEELAAIRADPAQNKAYNSMLRGYRDKTTKLAEKQREIEAQAEEARQAQRLVDALNDNPEDTIRKLAERQGLTISQATAAIKKVETDEELVKLFGESAGEVQPIFDSVVDKRVQARLEPVAARLQQIEEAQQKRQIAADILEFQNELAEQGEEVTEDIEVKMQELTKVVDPGPETTTKQYVKILYDLATSGKTRKEIAKDVANRMTRAVRSRTPAELPTTGDTLGPAITDKMTLREALRAAAPSVRREMGRR
jgi:DNA-binding MarR family transcriptional regulator